MAKIAFFDAKTYDRPFFDKYAALAGIELSYFDTRLNESTAWLANGFDGVIIFVNDSVNAVTAQILHKCGIGILSLRCSGYNNVDLSATSGLFTIARVPAYSPHAVAEHAVAMLLTLTRKTHKAYLRTREYNFSLANLVGFELYGKTAGVIGTGKIGRAFVDICHGFGMNVAAFDKYPDYSLNVEYMNLERLLKTSDIISLHCPLTEETRHMINREALEIIKNGVYIVNTSRGALIDTEALIPALKNNKVGGACLDVYEEETGIFFEDRSSETAQDDTLTRLISLPNVLVTSHQAFLTGEALDKIAKTTIDNISAFFNGQISGNEISAENIKNNKPLFSGTVDVS